MSHPPNDVPLPRPDRTVVALAVLGPVVVLAAFLGAIALNEATFEFRDRASRQEGLDRGLASWRSVEAGQLSPSELMAEMDARMASRPDVVVLGNSMAGTNDPDLLARALGLRGDQVVVLSIPYSVGAHWRGVLEYGVIDKGYRPRLVIVQATLSNGLMPASTPRPGPLNDLWVARTRLQRAILSAVRDVPVAVLEPRQPDGKPTVAHRSMNRTFHPGRMDATLHGRSVPIADGTADDGSHLINPEGHLDVDDSDIPRIVELCDDNGLKLAWVAPPVMPGIGALGDVISDERLVRMRELIEGGGGSLLDLRAMPMDESHYFVKMDHPTDDGMSRTVLAMSDALLRDGALGQDLQGRVLRPLHPTEEPTGNTLGPRGIATWSFPPFEGPADWFEVRLLASAEGTPRVTVAGRELQVEVDDAGLVDLVVDGPPPAGPWEITVTAGDGPLTVHGLSVGRGAGRTVVVGTVDEVLGASVDLLAPGWIEGGVFVPGQVPVTSSGPVPPPPEADFFPDGQEAIFRLPRWSHVSDDATMALTPRWARCSPVRVLEDGRPLPGRHVARAQVRDSRWGRVAHEGDEVWFASSDRTPPYANGRGYTLDLDPDRRCDGAVWLYPSDTARLEVPTERRTHFHRPIHELSLVVAPTKRASGSVRFDVEVGGAVVATLEPTVAELREGPLVVTLDPPAPSDAAIVITATNQGRGYLLWTGAALAEAPGGSDPRWYAGF
ncbi:MAG: hypothetical protein H6738_05605 [Alphaproteobacteria bacterium]|nr:hypothetical protein [Alphaproteobacteria bacterium]MCB9696244.1 hypothetical protein [Alphaproteobacteria bacterium]